MVGFHEISRVRGPLTGYRLHVEDYDKNPALGRTGLWVGAEYQSSESVTLGIPTLWPAQKWVFGFDTKRAVFLLPFEQGDYPPRLIPGSQAVTYDGTISDEYAITLTIAPGADEECHIVNALSVPELTMDELTFTELFARKVCLTGYEIVWPKEKLAEEARWWKDFYEDIAQRVSVPLFGTPTPPGPVEAGLRSLRGNQVVEIRAGLDEIRRLEETGGQDGLVRALTAGLVQTVATAVMPFALNGRRGQEMGELQPMPSAL